MLQLIAIIILFGSAFGMAVILFRKIPALAALPSKKKQGFAFRPQLRKKAAAFFSEKVIIYEKYLQKILSKIRVLSLRADSKTSGWLSRLRQKAKQNRLKKIDNYWERLKKSTRKK